MDGGQYPQVNPSEAQQPVPDNVREVEEELTSFSRSSPGLGTCRMLPLSLLRRLPKPFISSPRGNCLRLSPSPAQVMRKTQNWTASLKTPFPWESIILFSCESTHTHTHPHTLIRLALRGEPSGNRPRGVVRKVARFVHNALPSPPALDTCRKACSFLRGCGEKLS